MKYKFIFLSFFCLFSCSKTQFLNEKPDASLTVPTTLAHLQAMLDSDAGMNGALGFSRWFPGMLEVGTDDFFFLENAYNTTMPEHMKKIYTWQTDPYPGIQLGDWNSPYALIFRCNFILEKLQEIGYDKNNKAEYDHIHASALFYRTFAYSALTALFSPIFDPSSENNVASIPIRRSSDLNESLTLATVKEIYELMTNDLKLAIPFLPSEPLYKTRPSKRSCMALLSRIYLYQSDFEKAYTYADSALMINNDLLDYNEYSTTINYPFPRFNAEVIFNCAILMPTGVVSYMNKELVDLYDPNDLRLYLYFKHVANQNAYRFYGNYDGSQYQFAGLANDEVLLTRAEAAARTERLQQGLEDLNDLMVSRWKKEQGTSLFVPYTSMSKDALISIILQERRKQLVWRGVRWQDLKRLNLDTKYQKTVYRNIGGQVFELPPNSPKYLYPIPSTVTEFNKNLIK